MHRALVEGYQRYPRASVAHAAECFPLTTVMLASCLGSSEVLGCFTDT